MIRYLTQDSHGQQLSSLQHVGKSPRKPPHGPLRKPIENDHGTAQQPILSFALEMVGEKASHETVRPLGATMLVLKHSGTCNTMGLGRLASPSSLQVLFGG